jgi:hypothetical protein
MPQELIGELLANPIHWGWGVVGRAAIVCQPVQVADNIQEPAYSGRVCDLSIQAGFGSLLAMQLARPDRLVGALVPRRKSPGALPAETAEVL